MGKPYRKPAKRAAHDPLVMKGKPDTRWPFWRVLQDYVIQSLKCPLCGAGRGKECDKAGPRVGKIHVERRERFLVNQIQVRRTVGKQPIFEYRARYDVLKLPFYLQRLFASNPTPGVFVIFTTEHEFRALRRQYKAKGILLVDVVCRPVLPNLPYWSVDKPSKAKG